MAAIHLGATMVLDSANELAIGAAQARQAEACCSDDDCSWEGDSSDYADEYDVFPLQVSTKSSPGRSSGHTVEEPEKLSRRNLHRATARFSHVQSFMAHKDERVWAHIQASQSTKKEAARTQKERPANRHGKIGSKLLTLKPGEALSCSSFWSQVPPTVEESVKLAINAASKVKPLKEEKCCICLEDLTEKDEDAIQLRKCLARHPFHAGCIESALSVTPRCPLCFVPYAAVMGTQPPGTMTVQREAFRLPSEREDTIVVRYVFPNGTQTARHPSPGSAFWGTTREAYLPYSLQGRMVARLLMAAWDLRVLFTVGTSVTTGATDSVVWNGIHHKTSTHGGPTAFGYPDPTYLDRVQEELAAYAIH